MYMYTIYVHVYMYVHIYHCTLCMYFSISFPPRQVTVALSEFHKQVRETVREACTDALTNKEFVPDDPNGEQTHHR